MPDDVLEFLRRVRDKYDETEDDLIHDYERAGYVLGRLIEIREGELADD